MFKNRRTAGADLAKKLQKYKGTNAVVVAIPRGGLPLGQAIAQSLNLPLEIALAKKIGHPTNREFAIGAVSLDNIFISDAGNISQTYIDLEVNRIRQQLQMRKEMFYNGHHRLSLKNKTVLIVDDGVATGSTLLATIDVIKKSEPEKIIIAIPVASQNAINKLEQAEAVDEIVCLLVPPVFDFVGAFYEDFGQVSDEEAIAIFKNIRNIENRSDWQNSSYQLPEFQ